MKPSIHHTAVAALLVLSSLSASAIEPTVSILSPQTGTVIYSNVYPFVQSITFSVSHPTGLDRLNALNVFIGDQNLLGGSVGNPFNSQDCNPQLKAVTSSCSVNMSTATISVPWTISSIGSYAITVSTKHTGDTGQDSETVSVQHATTEYPAPPAVANAYINASAHLKSMSGKRRGCIISRVADSHARGTPTYYGPKGGPYNNGLIHSDVEALASACQ
ncbi:hypothetical protein [Caldimonas tepidiphila]|uniref:hypothetical protein n=1 Tax=Caldimonas tepidiphila TaxID=2315841 RepID=UPI000E5ABF4A|nr:hypothetical protein [Caldimonas tepidiphila]